ncbi:MAG TPA: hypothetical protein VGG64_26600 [Pirellulales bacterium]|jgi:hypothetical protein
MSDNRSHHQQVASLIAQDREINDLNIKDFRMKLELSLAKWERDGQLVRRAGWIAAAVTILGMFTILPLQAIPALRQNVVAHFVWCLAWFASLAIAGFFIVLYREKYAPAIKRARFDLQTTMIQEMQKQIEELRKQVELLGK